MDKFKVGIGMVIGIILGVLIPKVLPATTSEVSFYKIDPAVVLADVNSFRQSKGLSAVTENKNVCSVAQTRLPEVEINWSHDGFSAARFCVINCHIGENLARNIRSEQDIVDAWEASPKHNEVMSMSDMKYGCVVSNGQYTVLELSSTTLK